MLRVVFNGSSLFMSKSKRIDQVTTLGHCQRPMAQADHPSIGLHLHHLVLAVHVSRDCGTGPGDFKDFSKPD
tara:strand:+ start:17929 stop:18144 length:216 start_codon:yes stop_codon:yes gene_type:complete